MAVARWSPTCAVRVDRTNASEGASIGCAAPMVVDVFQKLFAQSGHGPMGACICPASFVLSSDRQFAGQALFFFLLADSSFCSFLPFR